MQRSSGRSRMHFLKESSTYPFFWRPPSCSRSRAASYAPMSLACLSFHLQHSGRHTEQFVLIAPSIKRTTHKEGLDQASEANMHMRRPKDACMTHQRPSKFTRSSMSSDGSLKLLRPSLSWSMRLRQSAAGEELWLPGFDKAGQRVPEMQAVNCDDGQSFSIVLTSCSVTLCRAHRLRTNCPLPCFSASWREVAAKIE